MEAGVSFGLVDAELAMSLLKIIWAIIITQLT